MSFSTRIMAAAFLLSSCGAQLSTTSLKTSELNKKKELFVIRTNITPGCFTANTRDCITGLDKLLALTTSQPALFKTNKIDSIEVDKVFRNVDITGSITIDFKASNDAIAQHINNQTDQYPTMKKKREQFMTKTKIKIGCYVTDLTSCLTGLDKMLALTSTDTFAHPNYDIIVIDRTFTDASRNGTVQIDFRATTDAIRTFLLKQ